MLITRVVIFVPPDKEVTIHQEVRSRWAFFSLFFEAPR